LFDARTGKQRWRVEYPAVALTPLDYGNSPRATPLISEGKVYLLGALGHLHCVDLATGRIRWFSHLSEEYQVRPPKWGFAGSPLRVASGVVVQPGAADAALTALHPDSGDTVWETPGRPAAYSSSSLATVGGTPQIVGLDEAALVGWDPVTGRELWKIEPPNSGDFNVPAPFVLGDRLFAASENNGARLYRFDERGVPDPNPVATNEDLAPDAHSPVPAGKHVFGLGAGGVLLCLEATHLKTRWATRDSLGHYASMISDGRSRVLTLTDKGGLYLHDAASPEPLGFLQLTKESRHLLAHPALVGNRLYLRLGEKLVCMEL
jgi:outer membrane protein assembly factor BamB